MYGAVLLAVAGIALWIITSDHGEGMGNHHYIEHSQKIYNEQLHVPLIFHRGDGGLKPREISELVRHVDILPTPAELVGYPLGDGSPHVQGDTLVPFLRGEEILPDRSAFPQRRPPTGRGKKRGDPSGCTPSRTATINTSTTLISKTSFTTCRKIPWKDTT
ncbi:MAG: sulfatase-like hydrolase/transferase [PVC group bacterium]